MTHVGRWFEGIYPECPNKKEQKLEKVFDLDLIENTIQKQVQVLRDYTSHIFLGDHTKTKDSPTKVKETCEQSLH